MKLKVAANNLTRNFFHTVCLLLFSATSFCQATLKGKVLNETTGDAVAGASIYFNNTSIGTSSGNTGQFTLTLPAFANPELIVSSVGFDVIVFKITAEEDLNSSFVFKLKPKQQLLQNILILPDVTRRKYLRIFIENFLGLTEEADRSNIKNLDAVYFTKSGNEKNNFNAYADTPLIIINHLLGYRIHFQLQEFSYNEQTGSTSFYGYTLYEEMGDKKRWIKRRRKAYFGSTMHFFRSLIADKLEAESYKIFVVKTDTIKEPNGNSRAMDMAIAVTAKQILQPDTTGKHRHIASWKNKLMVQYGLDPASKAYLSKRVMINGSLPRGFRSYLYLTSDHIEIDNNGILLNPMDILFGGYWIYEKAANLLPYDYSPAEK